MSRQTVFNKALAHLRAQGGNSLGSMGCAYRGDEGLKCAIGIFIADRKYNQDMEGNTVDCACVFDALPESVAKTGEQFLSDLQSQLHDDLPTYGFLRELELAALSFADFYNLKYSAPEQTQ